MATPRLEVIVIFDVDDLDDNGRFSTKDVVAAIARFNELSPGCMDLGELSEASLSPCANIANLACKIFSWPT